MSLGGNLNCLKVLLIQKPREKRIQKFIIGGVQPCSAIENYTHLFICLLVDCSLSSIFPPRSSRSSSLRYGLPSCMSVKTTYRTGAVWFFSPPFQAIIHDARPLGTFETQDGRHYYSKTRYISTTSRKNRGL